MMPADVAVEVRRNDVLTFVTQMHHLIPNSPRRFRLAS